MLVYSERGKPDYPGKKGQNGSLNFSGLLS